MERWKQIKGYEGIYDISDNGKIKSVRSGMIRKWNTSNDYPLISLCKDGHKTCFRVHRLVAFHFVPNPLNLPEVNHKDLKKLNAHYSNLEWSTRQDNASHAVKNGLLHNMVAEKLSDDAHLEISNLVKQGYSLKELSERFNVTVCAIGRAKRRMRGISLETQEKFKRVFGQSATAPAYS